MSRLAGRGRGDLFIEGKNNLLIWLMDQNLKIHPQRPYSPAFLLAGASSKTEGRLFAAGRAVLGEATSPKGRCGCATNRRDSGDTLWCLALDHPTHPRSGLTEGIKKKKMEHDVWFPQGLDDSCPSSSLLPCKCCLENQEVMLLSAPRADV